jgi:sulfite exporter TauE/SafE
MLASITPLGERSRRSRWGITVTAFVAGSTMAGATTGAIAGAIGVPIPVVLPASIRAMALVALVGAGVLLDLRVLGASLPSVRRQVNEQWLNRYRGWVYGVGFGAQLGTGVATVVTTSAVYSMLASIVLSGSPAWGALIGTTFGVVRGATILPAWRVRSPGDLVATAGFLRRWERRASAVSAGLLSGVVVVAAVGAVR